MNVSTPWLDEEHRALDHALAEVEFLAERRAFRAAARRFKEFQARCLQHLERRHAEHERAQFEVALEAVASSLDQGDYGDFCYGIGALGKILAAHAREEERRAS